MIYACMHVRVCVHYVCVCTLACVYACMRRLIARAHKTHTTQTIHTHTHTHTNIQPPATQENPAVVAFISFFAPAAFPDSVRTEVNIGMRRQTGRWTDDTHKQCVCGWVGEWVVKERKEKSERARERDNQALQCQR